MREPPDLPRAEIVRVLLDGFGVRVAALVFLSIGEDVDSWAFRVESADGPAFFLKVRARIGRVRGAVVPDHLRRLGVSGVLAPLPTGANAPYVSLDRFALMLYPFIDGGTGADLGLSPDQWRQLGAVTKEIHAVPITPNLTRMLGRERFRPSRRDVIADVEALMADPPDLGWSYRAGDWP